MDCPFFLNLVYSNLSSIFNILNVSMMKCGLSKVTSILRLGSMGFIPLVHTEPGKPGK